MKTLPRNYKGTQMRSTSETKFAEWCDAHKLQWMYEPDGIVTDGICYLPDFYLPEIKTIVEVKPAMFEHEAEKMHPLIDHPKMKDYSFMVVDMYPVFKPLLFWEAIDWFEGHDDKYIRSKTPDTTKNSLWLNWCIECGKPIFCSWGLWDCKHCGTHDGDHHFTSNPHTGIDYNKFWR